MPKTAMLAFRIAEEMKAELERCAAAEDRSVSNLVERILRDWLVDKRESAGEPAKKRVRRT